MKRTLLYVAVGALLISALVLELLTPKPAASPYPTVQTVTTGLGLTAYLVSDPTLPIVSLKVHLPAGSAYDPPDKRGVAYLAAALLDEGAADLDAAAFQEKLEDLAVSFSAGVDRDHLTLTLKTTTETLDEAFDLLKTVLERPRFDADAIERMRAAILASIRYESGDPSSIAATALFARIFGDHPYAFDEKGTDASVRALSRDDLIAWHRARVTRQALAIGVAGDINVDRLAVLLDRTFGGLPETAAGPDLPIPAPVYDGAVVPVPLAVPQSTVQLAQPGLLRPDPDWQALYLLNYVMGGGGFQSRLMEEVREKRGLAYSAYSALVPLDRAGVWLVGTATENARVAESLSVIQAEWARMAEEGPTDAEVAEAKTYLIGAWPLRFTSTGGIASMLASMRVLDLPPTYIATRNADIEALTPADIHAVARRVMNPGSLGGVVVGPAAAAPAAPEARP